MEIAHWINVHESAATFNVQRIYIGYETYLGRMLDCEYVIRTIEQLNESNRKIAVVTPFLTQEELNQVCKMIEAVASKFSEIEIVCNDWGLLQWILESNIVIEPVVGRLLVGQATDPRLAALNSPENQRLHEKHIRHADGTEVELLYRRPTDTLMKHIRSCSIAIPDVFSFLYDLGVRRFEISNLLQGINLIPFPEWSVTLHLPEVIVAIAHDKFDNDYKKWLHQSFPVQLYQRDNIIFYNNDEVPENIEEGRVDRLVYRSANLM